MKLESDCAKLSAFFGLFSNPLRLKILCSLKEGELTITQIVNIVGSSKHNISQQLKFLRMANIITQRREKRFVYCSIKQMEVMRLLERVAKTINENDLKG
ncbi:MAG: helix-turn-helix transcriptional regulator [Bacteriovoracaceae bacterium]|nr:helix-turn-helix transcriptional regulator [Bacteriovoracaceae bacterium]